MARPSITALSPVTGKVEIVTKWNREERGSADRYQMRLYATNVAIAMGMTLIGELLSCIHCGEDFHVPSLGDCDRPNDARGYLPGNVVMICRMCNESRGFMQQGHHDLVSVQAYRDDVLSASRSVTVPSKGEAISKRSQWRGAPRQRVGSTSWIRTHLSRSPYFN